MKFACFILCFLAFNSVSDSAPRFIFDHEGGGNSNGGGGGVLCEKDGKRTVVTLDYYEARLSLKDKLSPALIQYDRPNASISTRITSTDGFFDDYFEVASSGNVAIDQAVQELTSTVRRIPKLYQIMNNYLYEKGVIQTDNWISTSLEEFADHNKAYKIAEKDCRYVQLALRQENRIYKDQEMFDLMPASQKAILIFHEAIYYAAKESLAADVKDSSVVRQVITMLLSKLVKVKPDSDVENARICKQAELLGLCKIKQYSSASPEEKLKFDMIDHEYYGDIFGFVLRQIREVEFRVKHDVTFKFTDAASRDFAFANQSRPLNERLNDSAFTVAELYFDLKEQYENYRSYSCSPVVTPAAVSGEAAKVAYSPFLVQSRVKACVVSAKVLSRAIERMTLGFQKNFCVKDDDTNCKSMTIPSLLPWFTGVGTNNIPSREYGWFEHTQKSLARDLKNFEALQLK